MAESENDDLADALNQISADDIAPSDEEPPAPISLDPPAHLVHPASSRPQVPQPPAERPQTPSRPVAPAIPDLPAKPAPPASAARVTIRAATPVTRKARPMAPTITNNPTNTEVAGDQFTSLSGDNPEIVDDQDIDIMPMPDVSVLAQTTRQRPSAKAKTASRKHLEFRRTMIPILFTCGIVMFCFASLKYVSGGESSLAILPVWVPILLVIAGAIVVALAVVNMLTVKAQLENNGPGAI